MKLLYLTDRLSHRGGAPHHLLDLISVMARDHTITVAAADKDRDVALPEHVQFVRCSGLRHSRGHTGGLSKLPGLLSRADGVHVQNVMNPEALRLACGPRTIVTVQDHRVFCPGPGKTLPTDRPCVQPMSESQCDVCIPDEDHRRAMVALTHARLQAIQTARRVIVLSHYMAECLAGVGLPGADVVPPPVPVDPREAASGANFMIAGRLVHHKGIDIALRAFRQANPGCELRIAGLGNEDLDGATAMGWLDRAALREELRSARALLFPARWQEPFGIVGVEALAVGTPVIAMKRGGMGAWTDAGTLVVDDVEQMSDAITRLSRDTALAQRLGEAGQVMVAERFSPRRHEEAMKAVYGMI